MIPNDGFKIRSRGLYCVIKLYLYTLYIVYTLNLKSCKHYITNVDIPF